MSTWNLIYLFAFLGGAILSLLLTPVFQWIARRTGFLDVPQANHKGHRQPTPLLGGAAAGVCRGLIEATGGCARVIECGGRLALPITGFLITFGGLSIILQQLCYLTKCGVKPLAFIAAKALQGGVCFLLLLPFAMA